LGVVSLIAIDLGTSFIKAGVLNLDTLQLEQVQRVPFPAPLTGRPALYREYDPAAIMVAVRQVLREIAPASLDCDGIVMCTQMHGVVWTTEQGEARSMLTTWQDQRVLEAHPSGAGTYFEVMKARLTADEIRQTGNELRPGLPIGLLFWLAEQGQLPAGDLIPAALSDFVVANLCGAAPVTESTNGMAVGLLNLETLNWHDDMLYKLGLTKLHLPEVLPHGAPAGWLNWNGRKIPCYTPIGDYQCAILGALLQPDELSLNISTGSQVSLLRPQTVFGNFQTRPFFDGRCAITVTTIPAGRALNALVTLFSELATAQGVTLADSWGYIAQAAAAVPLPRLHANLAFYASAAGDRGAFTGLQEDELTIGHVFRAAFQNMTDNYHTFACRLSPEQAWSKIVFSGGLVQKMDVLRQMICDRFAVPHRLSPAQEDTLLGLMALGLTFTGRTASMNEATTVLTHAYSVETATG
jgi:sugar (pentulose or hexulose) kinase